MFRRHVVQNLKSKEQNSTKKMAIDKTKAISMNGGDEGWSF